MFKSYLKTTLRLIRRQKMYSFINVAGLSVGLACAILILLFVRDELGFDRFHENFARTYRVVMETREDGASRSLAITPLPLAPALRAEIPEIEAAARYSEWDLFRLGRDGTYFSEWLAFAEPEFLEIFSFPFKAGNPRTALSEGNSICLSETMARKYFGAANPLGRTLTLQDERDLEVTGVFKDVPADSHLQFEFLVSYATIRNDPRMNDWDSWSNDYTYVLVPGGTDPAALETKLQAVFAGNVPAEDAARTTLHLQPLGDIHFSGLGADIARTGDKVYLYVYPAIGALILLIACLNFISLSTARSFKRAKEVGMRKAVGARRAQIIRQFFAESTSLAFLSLVLAAGLVFALLPRANAFMRKDMAFNPLHDGGLILGLAALWLVVGAVAGSYPALYLSSFEPARVLKNAPTAGRRKARFRTATVVFQFAVCIALFVGTAVVFGQLRYMKNSNPGFAADEIVVLPLEGSQAAGRIEALRNDLLANPSILSATVSNGTPAGHTRRREGFQPEGAAEGREKIFQVILTDYDFVGTYGLKITSGRDLSREFPTDRDESVLINATAARELGWDAPVGKRLTNGTGRTLRVVGVVQDFHYGSMRTRIPAMMITLYESRPISLSLRIRPGNTRRVLAFLEATWKAHNPRAPFSYYFVDEEFGTWYRFEERLGTTFTGCALLAVFISCLGILGLASFFAEQRTKEIGIRKVLGASVPGMVGLISRDFVKWVLLANLIAWPAAWLVMSRWLEGYAFRIKMNVWMFILSGAAALALALLTSGFQAVRAALTDPVTSLRYE